MKKRIALSAVVALFAGLLAAAPASAAYTVTPPLTSADAPFTVAAADDVTFANATNTALTVTQVAGAANYVLFAATSTVDLVTYDQGIAVSGATLTPASIRCTDGSVFQTLSGGAKKLLASAIGANAVAKDAACAAAFGGGFAWDAVTENDALIKLPTTAAGALTVTVSGLDDNGSGQVSSTTLQTFTVNVRAAASTVYAYSTVAMAKAGNGWKGGDGAVYAPRAAVAGAVANLTVTQYANDGLALASDALAKPVTATLTGVGSIGTNATAGYSTGYFAKTLDASLIIPVFGDGRAGKATITVSVDGKTVSTKTVYFYGTATKVEAIGLKTIGAVAGLDTVGVSDTVTAIEAPLTWNAYAPASIADEDNSPAFAVVVTDALGTPIPLPVTMVSADSSKVIANNVDTFIDSGAGDYAAGVLLQHFILETGANAKSGDKVVVTWQVLAQDGTVLTSNPITVSIGGFASAVKLTLDKATYAQGEKATLTITGTDSSGNPVYDGAALIAGLSSNVAAQGFPVGAKVAASGKATATVYAPTATGTWTISGLDANGAAVSVSATVSSAADLAAAQAAIAALQTSVAALQTTVASLVASLTAQIKVINTALRKIAAKMKVKL